MARKDRLKVVTEQCRQMAALLRVLRKSANAVDKAKITDILEAAEEEISDISSATVSTNTDTDTWGSPESGGTSYMDQERQLGIDAVDALDENLHSDQQTRATGFVGKSSEVHWLRAALIQTEEPDGGDGGHLHQRTSSYVSGNDRIRTFSYWTEREQNDLDFAVDPEALPSPDVAERLLQYYFLKIHDSFPIFPRQTFQDQSSRHFASMRNGSLLGVDIRWKANLNLILAVAARNSHLAAEHWRGEENDHITYQARARLLDLNAQTITNTADLQQVQGLGLLSFYWMTSGQVSRAWTSIGLAVRFAYALGLHVRNVDPSATEATRETLVRTWWSLHWLESTLSAMTGRPSIIVDSRCSVPLPLAASEDEISNTAEHAPWLFQSDGSPTTPLQTISSSSSLALAFSRPSADTVQVEANSYSYFRFSVQLSVITQSILAALYSANSMALSSGEIQESIMQIERRLEQWLNMLPAEFDLQQLPSESSEPFARQRVLLGFRFCSTKILLTRPCLTGRRQAWTESSEKSFTARSADACVEAAKTVVALLPDEPQSDLVRDHGPWWSITHYTMQSISVLLLALSNPSVTSHSGLDTLQCTKKAIRWLQSIQDPVAGRAYHIALSALEVIGRRFGFDVSDLWSTGTGHDMYPGSHIAPNAFSMPAAHMVSISPAANADDAMANYPGPAFYSDLGPTHFNNPYYSADP